MKKNLALLSLIVSFLSFGQNAPSFWNKIHKEKISNKSFMFRKSEPRQAILYNLNIEALKKYLSDTPLRGNSINSSEKLLNIPTANDSFETYSILETPIMESTLQKKYPSIRTYVGKSMNNPSNTIRFSITPHGLHSMSFRVGYGTEFIDPYTKDGKSYLVYSKNDLPVIDEQWRCGFEEELSNGFKRNIETIASINANDGKLREFRLALACTVEYSEFHWRAAGLTSSASVAQKKEAVLAAIVVTINRNNFIYERDLSVTMTLVSNNDSIIFIDSDNFSNDNPAQLIEQSQDVIDATIGFSNYDIGHTFSTQGGGLAVLNAVCTSNKAKGITGVGSPVGDPYDVDYVAHELGHQFGAPHTFNGNGGFCNTNRTPSNAYEPGSGSTIMAYAGICSPQNIQSNSDAYFHQKSLQMMWNNIYSGNSTCASQTVTGNNAPNAFAGNDYTIPALTPYKLTGSSTDTDGITSHTYTWEQYDLGPAGLPAETNISGPLVRSFEGTNSPTRYIPRVSDILINGGTSTEWEKLASVDRDINFQLTVRDNDIRGGQTATDQMTISVNSNAGPFVVTSQNTNGQIWTIGSTETITWNVAGTTANGINETHVDILFSSDGINFDTVLADNILNDGSHQITVPDVASSKCRIMVAASNNIFYNINTEYIFVGVEEICTTYASSTALNLVIPDGIDANTPGIPLVASQEISEDGTILDVNFNINISHNHLSDLMIILKHPDGTQAVVFNRNCTDNDDINITLDDEALSTIDCNNTTSGTYQPSSALSVFDGKSTKGTWLIDIYDHYLFDIGILNNFSLEICYESILSTNNYDSDNLHVFPNPNSGSFNVKFHPRSGQDIVVQVYDLSGRSIYSKKYYTVNNFEENITLKNIESGVYILQILDEQRKIHKKIIFN